MESNGTLLSRDQILGAQDLIQDVVYVVEWGGNVIVRTLTATERDEFETSYLLEKAGKIEVDRRNLRAKLVARCAIDEAGTRLFSDADIALLGMKSAAAVDRLYSVAARLNRLTSKDVEDLAKN